MAVTINLWTFMRKCTGNYSINSICYKNHNWTELDLKPLPLYLFLWTGTIQLTFVTCRVLLFAIILIEAQAFRLSVDYHLLFVFLKSNHYNLERLFENLVELSEFSFLVCSTIDMGFFKKILENSSLSRREETHNIFDDLHEERACDLPLKNQILLVIKEFHRYSVL